MTDADLAKLQLTPAGEAVARLLEENARLKALVEELVGTLECYWKAYAAPPLVPEPSELIRLAKRVFEHDEPTEHGELCRTREGRGSCDCGASGD